MDECCAVPGNDCSDSNGHSDDWDTCSGTGCDVCIDQTTASSDWLFGLGPGPPQRFQPNGDDTDWVDAYQTVWADDWPFWGNGDLDIGDGRHPVGQYGTCMPWGEGPSTYGVPVGGICGGDGNWGATDVEVWYPI